MASFEEHCQECQEKLGDRCEEVNRLIDQFAHYPDMKFLSCHRQFLHHVEGIAYFAKRFGPRGEAAARLHVLRDCGHVPHAEEYYNGGVDHYGIPALP